MCIRDRSCNSNPIELVLKSDPYLKEIIKDKDDYEIQVMLTKVNHDNTKIDFQNYQYQHDEDQYFYPASTIKLPIVVLTLKKINELRSKGSDITLKSKIILNNVDNYSNFKLQDSITSFQNLIADIFLVSDNSASNILIDCLLYTSPSPRDISGSRMPSSA